MRAITAFIYNVVYCYTVIIIGLLLGPRTLRPEGRVDDCGYPMASPRIMAGRMFSFSFFLFFSLSLSLFLFPSSRTCLTTGQIPFLHV